MIHCHDTCLIQNGLQFLSIIQDQPGLAAFTERVLFQMARQIASALVSATLIWSHVVVFLIIFIHSINNYLSDS